MSTFLLFSAQLWANAEKCSFISADGGSFFFSVDFLGTLRSYTSPSYCSFDRLNFFCFISPSARQLLYLWHATTRKHASHQTLHFGSDRKLLHFCVSPATFCKSVAFPFTLQVNGHSNETHFLRQNSSLNSGEWTHLHCRFCVLSFDS